MSQGNAGVAGRITLVRRDGTSVTMIVDVIATHESEIVVRAESGQVVTVPLSAVTRFEPGQRDLPAVRPVERPDAAADLPPSEIPGTKIREKPTTAPKPRAKEFSDPLKIAVSSARSLQTTTERHSPSHDAANGRSINGQLQSLRLDLEFLHSHVSNKGYLRALESVVSVVDSAIERTANESLQEAKRLRGAYEQCRKTARRALERFSQTSSIIQGLKICLSAVSAAELHDWERFTSRFEAKPRLVTQDHLTANLSPSGEFILPFRVALDDGPEPARAVKLILDQHRGIEAVGNTPHAEILQPGETTTLRMRLQDRRRQGSRDEIKIQARLQYLGPNDDLLKSPHQRLTVRLVRPALFQEIPNPFRDYASGAPVDDPEMFFGRTHLIDDIIHHLTVRPVGRCYALYGQKRSGKSSVVNQLEVKLVESGALVARLSMGVVDRSSITQTFVAEIIDQLREQVASLLDSKTFSNLLTRWPEPSAITHQPLASLRKAITAARALLRSAGHGEPPRIIIMVDEFTYLFELLRRSHVAESDQDQLRDFMRQWKSLLEAKLFSALVVGQDTMPFFIETFPNEFSVMHTERLDYLLERETEELADAPIRRANGSSRFSGYGLQAIHSYTSGHPYYTQILCDRIVELANKNKRDDISDVDVEAAVGTLISGTREIGMFRFDCLLSADNTNALLDEMLSHAGIDSTETSSSQALRIAHRIAVMGGEQNKPVALEAIALTHEERRVFEDLCRRHVVVLKDGKAHLRILLFAEYLRES